jgi:predicted DNA-binding protein (MmcQ/YjbR family)
MSRAFVNEVCAALPGAERSDPWGGGHDAWKVGGKLFAVVGAVNEAVSVKCRDAETAELLVELGRAERAPYFHRSWVSIPLAAGAAGAAVGEDELAERLSTSYRLIRAALPKTLQRALEAAEAPAAPRADGT